MERRKTHLYFWCFQLLYLLEMHHIRCCRAQCMFVALFSCFNFEFSSSFDQFDKRNAARRNRLAWGYFVFVAVAWRRSFIYFACAVAHVDSTVERTRKINEWWSCARARLLVHSWLPCYSTDVKNVFYVVHSIRFACLFDRPSNEIKKTSKWSECSLSAHEKTSSRSDEEEEEKAELENAIE